MAGQGRTGQDRARRDLQRAQAEHPEPEHARGGLADVRVAPGLVKFQRAMGFVMGASACVPTDLTHNTHSHASVPCLTFSIIVRSAFHLRKKRLLYSQMCVLDRTETGQFLGIEWNAERPPLGDDSTY